MMLPFDIVQKILSYGFMNTQLREELEQKIVQIAWLKWIDEELDDSEESWLFWEKILPIKLKQKFLKQKNECELLFEYCDGIYIDWSMINDPIIIVLNQEIFKRSLYHIAIKKQMDIKIVDYTLYYNGKSFSIY